MKLERSPPSGLNSRTLGPPPGAVPPRPPPAPAPGAALPPPPKAGGGGEEPPPAVPVGVEDPHVRAAARGHDGDSSGGRNGHPPQCGQDGARRRHECPPGH